MLFLHRVSNTRPPNVKHQLSSLVPKPKKVLLPKPNPFINMVSMIMSSVLGAYCFYSVRSIFRVLNTDHRLDDLLPRAMTAKAFVSIPHPASRQQFKAHTGHFPTSRELCCSSHREWTGRRRADSDHYA